MAHRAYILRFIHSYSDATGFFAMHSWEIVALITYGNRILSSWRRCRVILVFALVTIDREQGILDIVMHNVLMILLVNPPLSGCER